MAMGMSNVYADAHDVFFFFAAGLLARSYADGWIRNLCNKLGLLYHR